MNLSAIFIKRPVTTTLLMAGILVFGALAYQQRHPSHSTEEPAIPVGQDHN